MRKGKELSDSPFVVNFILLGLTQRFSVALGLEEGRIGCFAGGVYVVWWLLLIVDCWMLAIYEEHIVEGAAYLKLSKSPAAAGLAF